MGSETIKILRFIISTTKISNYIYLGTGDKLSVLTTSDIMSDPDLLALATSRTLNKYFNSIDIIANASAKHAYGFLKIFEGRFLLKTILLKSSFVKRANSNDPATIDSYVEQYLDETLELMAKMGENDPF